MLDQSWLNVTEAAAYLRVSRQTLYNLMEAGELPYYTVKGLRGRRIKKEDLDALIKRSDESQQHED